MGKNLSAASMSLFLALAMVFFSPEAQADDGGFRHQSSVAVRVFPVGLSLFSNTGYRQPLWDDEESLLLTGTYLEGGVATAFSPAFGWVGPYVEFIPIAVLQLRLSAQFMGYFGNFGFLYVPDAETGDWSSEALNASDDGDLGQSSTGWMVQAQATPRMRLGGEERRVVITAETTFHWIQMDMESDYYEPYLDLLFAPDEYLWITRPTVGYLFGEDLSKGYFLLGARWERAMTSRTGLVRDTVGLVFNWKVPSTLMAWGDPSVAGFGGVFLDHPNRGRVSPYFGTQATFTF